MNATGEMHHIHLKPTVKGTMCLFNNSAWSNPHNSSIKVEGGNLLVCQSFYYNLETTEHIAEVNGGTLFISSAMLPKKAQFFVLGGGSVRSKGNLYKQLSSSNRPYSLDLAPLINGLGKYFPTNCWWI